MKVLICKIIHNRTQSEILRGVIFISIETKSMIEVKNKQDLIMVVRLVLNYLL